MPQVTISWAKKVKKNKRQKTKLYTFRGYHYKETLIFSLFDKDYFFKHLLPSDLILPFKVDDEYVSGNEMNTLIENLLQEIKQKKKSYKDFYILQKKNFNCSKQCGLLVLRFKKYPYVIKLFIENPKTFFRPHEKGVESIAFFYMSGGMNRHITGFTRLKNLEIAQSTIKNHPVWSQYTCTFPRKWFWLPRNAQWLEIQGVNINNQISCSTTIPSIYAVIADFIDTNEHTPIEQKKRSEIIINLCNDLDIIIDPHANNFIINKEESGIHIKMIDTEHFPSMVGFKEIKKFKNYNQWYQQLIEKCIHDMFFLLNT